LIVCAPTLNVATAARMVIQRRCSRRSAGVDAAEPRDRAGGEKKSFGESGLTGVDVRDDAEIERAQAFRPCRGEWAWKARTLGA
jgi:hypothetical protein